MAKKKYVYDRRTPKQLLGERNARIAAIDEASTRLPYTMGGSYSYAQEGVEARREQGIYRGNIATRNRLQDELRGFGNIDNSNYRDAFDQKEGGFLISSETREELSSHLASADIFSEVGFESILSTFQSLREGNDPVFKSRLATEQQFLFTQNQPGRRQTKNISTQQQLGSLTSPKIATSQSLRPRILK